MLDKCSHTVTVGTVGGKQLSVTLMHAKYGYTNSTTFNLVLAFTSLHTKHKLSSHTTHIKQAFGYRFMDLKGFNYHLS